MTCLVGIGSNIRPLHHIGAALETIIHRHGTCTLSRAVWTTPHNIDSDRSFVNLAVLMPLLMSADALKRQFNAIETELGRDRTDPLRKLADRPIDLDILCDAVCEQTSITAYAPPYMQTVMAELQAFVRQQPPLPVNDDATATFTVEDIVVGIQPLVLALDSSNNRIIRTH